MNLAKPPIIVARDVDKRYGSFYALRRSLSTVFNVSHITLHDTDTFVSRLTQLSYYGIGRFQIYAVRNKHFHFTPYAALLLRY